MPNSGRKDELVESAAECEALGVRAGPTGLEAKESAHQIAGHTGAIEECKDQSSGSRTAAVHKSISELGDNVTRAAELRQEQHFEFVTSYCQQCCCD